MEARLQGRISSYTIMEVFHTIHASRIWRAVPTLPGASAPLSWPILRAIRLMFVKRAQ
jgi:hypothetical protein